MTECRLSLALKFRNDSLRQHFAQLDAPLVELVNIPDHPLRENGVFIQTDESSERFRCQLISENNVRWTVTLKNSMRYEPLRSTLRSYLFRCLPESERFRLSEGVRQKHVMMPIGLRGWLIATKSHAISRVP
jgi:hypothetical protein